jgi:hypothetical protein
VETVCCAGTPISFLLTVVMSEISHPCWHLQERTISARSTIQQYLPVPGSAVHSDSRYAALQFPVRSARSTVSALRDDELSARHAFVDELTATERPTRLDSTIIG